MSDEAIDRAYRIMTIFTEAERRAKQPPVDLHAGLKRAMDAWWSDRFTPEIEVLPAPKIGQSLLDMIEEGHRRVREITGVWFDEASEITEAMWLRLDTSKDMVTYTPIDPRELYWNPEDDEV